MKRNSPTTANAAMISIGNRAFAVEDIMASTVSVLLVIMSIPLVATRQLWASVSVDASAHPFDALIFLAHLVVPLISVCQDLVHKTFKPSAALYTHGVHSGIPWYIQDRR